MGTDLRQSVVSIEVNDVFDDLKDENNRLLNELMFANNCLNVLNQFKDLLSKFYLKFNTIIETEDKLQFLRLQKQYDLVRKSREQLSRPGIELSHEIVLNPMIGIEEQIDGHKVEENVVIIESLDELPKGLNNSYNSNEANDYSSDEEVDKSGDHFEVIEIKKENEIQEVISAEVDESQSDEDMSESAGSSDQMKFRTISEGTKTIWICGYDECGKQLASKRSLKTHIKLFHTLEKPHKCDICHKYFVSLSLCKLRGHQLIHSGVKYKCNFCSFEASYKHNLSQHMKIKHLIRKKTIKCQMDYCDKVFKTPHEMSKHVKRTHCGLRRKNKRPDDGPTLSFSQEYQGFASVVRNQSNSNSSFDDSKSTMTASVVDIESIAEPGKLCCPWRGCHKRLHHKRHLEEHMNSHLNIRPFVCDLDGCPKRYFSRRNLKVHQKSCHQS